MTILKIFAHGSYSDIERSTDWFEMLFRLRDPDQNLVVLAQAGRPS